MFWNEVIPPTIIMTVLFSAIALGVCLFVSHFFGSFFSSWQTILGSFLIIVGISFIFAVFAFSAAHQAA